MSVCVVQECTGRFVGQYERAANTDKEWLPGGIGQMQRHIDKGPKQICWHRGMGKHTIFVYFGTRLSQLHPSTAAPKVAFA
jgi:hypothetical protein